MLSIVVRGGEVHLLREGEDTELIDWLIDRLIVAKDTTMEIEGPATHP